nr:hypothetical protein [Hyphomonas sp. Mor2]
MGAQEMDLKAAIAKAESLNASFLAGDRRAEAEHVGALLEEFSKIDMMDFTSFGEPEPAGPGVSTLTVHSTDETMVLIAFLKANAVMAAHDHKDFIGGMRVLEGSLKVETFAYVQGQRPDKMDIAQLKREDSAQMAAGETASILSNQSQIHQIIAGKEGAVFLDVYTMFNSPGSCRFYDTSGSETNTQEIEAKPLIDIAIH